MPEVNGKKYPYTAKGKAAAKKAAARKGMEDPGYGPNPADGPVIIDGMRVSKPVNYSKMSKSAMKGKDAAKMARAEALKAIMKRTKKGLIPASPTR